MRAISIGMMSWDVGRNNRVAAPARAGPYYSEAHVPTHRTRLGGCSRATNGHAVTPQSTAMNKRRFTR